MFPEGAKSEVELTPRISSTARTVWTKSFWTVEWNWNLDNISGKCGPTLSIAGSECSVLKRLVDSLDRKDALETRVDMREGGHDCGPDQGTMVVLWGLYERIQSCDGGESHEITCVELDVRGAPVILIWASGFLES